MVNGDDQGLPPRSRFESLLSPGGTALTADDIQRLLAAKGNVMDLNTANYFLTGQDPVCCGADGVLERTPTKTTTESSHEQT